ncbi:B3 domain-containing protein Os01g0723500-like isoform X1 [Pyrus communis]|uniref:B3 domain-containing protein Os01g0723500-like isoform X1 n=1 Tax=Pyrus communis TaxID=23211 RepID=UPI0035C13B1F
MARKPKKPSFIKILAGDTSQSLRVPPAFITKNFNGRSLCKCDLKGPTGIRRTVELEERENGLFFHDGWQGFVKDHLLEAGDFLVFSYDGVSKFNVKIYDRSACEKDVEVAKMNEGNQARRKVEVVDIDTENVKAEVVDIDTVNYNQDREKQMIFSSRSCDHLKSRKRPVSNYVEDTSTASILLETENPCFLHFLNHRNRLYNVRIPKQLAFDEGLMDKDSVTLQDPDGRSWFVRLRTLYADRFDYLNLSTGWRECGKANQISLGDTIVFEFVKQSVIQVHIFRKGEVRGNVCRLVLVAPYGKKKR